MNCKTLGVAEMLHPKGFSFFTEIVDGGSIDDKNLPTGFYIVKNSNVATLPDSFSGTYHGLININTGAGVSFQMLMRRDPTTIIARGSTGDGWKSWSKVTLS